MTPRNVDRVLVGGCIGESDRMNVDRCYEELIDYVKDNQKLIM